jgi:adenine-specific DNA-methyltransferase
LLAFASALPPARQAQLEIVGLDTDATAVDIARERLSSLNVSSLSLRTADFLTAIGDEHHDNQRTLPIGTTNSECSSALDRFDVVIANPPYVRTQILGTSRARELARRFGLSGRVDLYHAFLKAIARALRERGVLGFLTSNRFLVTQAGRAMRDTLRHDFRVVEVIDLGDTKLFSAAVLPAIVIAQRDRGPAGRSLFTRIYELRDPATMRAQAVRYDSTLDALAAGAQGSVEVKGLHFRIERGHLAMGRDSSDPWLLSTSRIEKWQAAVRANTVCYFGDVGKIRVGIKTTADSVFIRSDWKQLDENIQPERELLRPLITHRIAARWRAACDPASVETRVLYPHTVKDGVRVPVDLNTFPHARSYLEAHRARLSSRRYVLDAGRVWYELWVPQNPNDWLRPKLVFPDISETPRFFLEGGGAIVNGDCYWIQLRAGRDPSLLLLMLAVANSRFMLTYYDIMFNNKLYAGRRRFIAQYVAKFPLPDDSSPNAREVIRLMKELMAAATVKDLTLLEAEVDSRVWRLFGVEEIAWQRDLELAVNDPTLEALK